jgi:hypothetical protein
METERRGGHAHFQGELAVDECILGRRCKGGSKPLASARPISAEVSKTSRYIANRTLLHARGIDATLHSLAQSRFIFHAWRSVTAQERVGAQGERKGHADTDQTGR